MNIVEAMKAAKNGKRLKRKEWGYKIFTAANVFWVFKSTTPYNIKTLTLDDILADDWEVLE